MALGGGGIVTIIVVIAIFLLGGNPLGDGVGPLGGLEGQSVGTEPPGKVLTECRTGADANEREDWRILAVVNSV